MRVLNNDPSKTILITIKKEGYNSENLAISETCLLELDKHLKKVLSQTPVNIMIGEKSTRVKLQESRRITKNSFISFSFKGLTPLNFKNLIIKNIKL